MRLSTVEGGERLAGLFQDHDEFELRGAASWLVEHGYARWVPDRRIAITSQGVQAIAAIRELTS